MNAIKRLTVLGYHDVVEKTHEETSGVPGPGAFLYKLERQDFKKQMTALKRRTDLSIISIDELFDLNADRKKVILSFDDGGVSAYTIILNILEELGLLGHFFIIGSCIGKEHFVNASQIREIKRKGHIIGTHSFSHPDRISSLSSAEIYQEWKKSINVLEDIIGEKVDLASVPNGYCNRKVITAAAEAGIRWLFTSDPTTSVKKSHGCAVLGRYTIQRGHDENYVTAIAQGKVMPMITQTLSWKLKGVVKKIGGNWYLTVRKRILKMSMNYFQDFH